MNFKQGVSIGVLGAYGLGAALWAWDHDHQERHAIPANVQVIAAGSSVAAVGAGYDSPINAIHDAEYVAPVQAEGIRAAGSLTITLS